MDHNYSSGWFAHLLFNALSALFRSRLEIIFSRVMIWHIFFSSRSIAVNRANNKAFGMHEDVKNYLNCRARLRNKGLFTADQVRHHVYYRYDADTLDYINIYYCFTHRHHHLLLLKLLFFMLLVLLLLLLSLLLFYYYSIIIIIIITVHYILRTIAQRMGSILKRTEYQLSVTRVDQQTSG